jgi:restriction system protein
LQETDLTRATGRDDIKALLRSACPDAGEHVISNHAGQIAAFVLTMRVGDLVATPLRSKSAIALGRIESEFRYDPNQTPPYRFWRDVKWINPGVARILFDPDLLFSLGAIQTICQIKRNDAERRVRELAEQSTEPDSTSGIQGRQRASSSSLEQEILDQEQVDLERLARDQIARFVIEKFKGHGMARLVDAILKAQGYSTHCSPEGPDKGVDILAAPGPLGFGHPRICVQVKSQQSPVDRPTLDQLIGTMKNVHAEQGLLVSWGGFKSSVEKEVANHYFEVRLWDSDALIEELLDHYNELDEDLRADLPLKRIWTITTQDE